MTTEIETAIEALNQQFAIHGLARCVAGKGNLPKIEITAPGSSAEIYLHGAHVTSWRPAGAEDVIFLSEHSRWEDGKAIRGGVPICFPWFRAKADSPQAPVHGFVRTKSWQLASLTQKGDAVVAELETSSNDDTRKWWPYDFHLLHRVTVGANLTMELVVTNTGSTPLRFEEALHSYHRVGEVHGVRVAGLDGTAFLDNTDGNREKTQQGDIVLTKPTDNAYLRTQSALELIDPTLQRCIRIEKQHSGTTIVWNPSEQGAKALADLGDDEWKTMLCIEASNILGSAVELAPGKQHVMTATISVS
jgi:glucose-6-phosphate 1-epimerase